MSASRERAREWAFVRAGFAVAALLAAAWTLGWLVDDAVHDEPSPLELTTRCLENEKGRPVTLVLRDPIALSAGRGALATTVEGNPVTVVIGSSGEDAARVESSYRAVADVEGRIERRGRIVYLFARPPSPTQRQVLYDCAYE